MDSQLGHDVFDMCVSRPFGDSKPGRDLLAGKPFGEQLTDLSLARREVTASPARLAGMVRQRLGGGGLQGDLHDIPLGQRDAERPQFRITSAK
jgi:hypothetical protein